MRASAKRRPRKGAALPAFVQPQLSKLVKQPPAGTEWLHEIKFDCYRMHARLDRGDVQLLADQVQRLPCVSEVFDSGALKIRKP